VEHAPNQEIKSLSELIPVRQMTATAAGSNANSVEKYIIAAVLELGCRKNLRLREKTLGVGSVGTKVGCHTNTLENDPPRECKEFPSSLRGVCQGDRGCR
jgi:hypothetical protein